MVLVDSKRGSGKCIAYGCCKPSVKKKGELCHTHYRRKMKEKDPVFIRYRDFKSNALRRGHVFTVTLEQFRKFCVDNNYIIKKGNRGRNMTIDRRCNIHGYHIWNMQVLTLLQNQRKGTKHSGDNFDCPF